MTDQCVAKAEVGNAQRRYDRCGSLLLLVAVGCGAAGGDGRDSDGFDSSGFATSTGGSGTDGISDSADDQDDPEPRVPEDPEICGNGVDDDGNGTIDDTCTCGSGQTQPCYPEGLDDPCPGLQTCEGDSEILGWGECVVDPQCGASDTDRDPFDACDTAEPQTTTQTLTFPSPLETLGECPWAHDDNLPQEGGAMAARHEVRLPIDPPEGAVICSATFSVPQTSMYYDDRMYVVFNDVIVLAPGDWSEFLDEVDGLLIYDWLQIRGTSGGGDVFCPGAGSLCALPDTQQDGSIELSLDDSTQRALFERAAEQGSYSVMVAATGDNDPDIDCDHSAFDLQVTYEYVVP